MTFGNDRSLASIAKDVLADVQEIVRSEVRLAKAEVKEEGRKAANAARMSAIGAVLGLYSVGVLLFFVIRFLDRYMDPRWSALLVGVAMAALALIFWNIGRERFKTVNPTPEKTIESVKENLQWNKSRPA